MPYTVTSATRPKIKQGLRQKILREYRHRMRADRTTSAAGIEEQTRARYGVPWETWAKWMMNIQDGVWTWDGIRVKGE